MLTEAGYQQTRAKLAALLRRRAEILTRTDLTANHRQRVLDSYREMIVQYTREIKLYEARHTDNGDSSAPD